MIRARAFDLFHRDTLGVAIVRDAPTSPGRLQQAMLTDTAEWEWVDIDDHVTVEPLVFPPGAAAALSEAFARLAASQSGYVPTDARSDYLAERARVDKLVDALIGMTGR